MAFVAISLCIATGTTNKNAANHANGVDITSEMSHRGTREITGVCDEGFEWTYNEDTYSLTLRGTGEITQWTCSESDWEEVTKSANIVELGEGITCIGNYFFLLL